MLGNVSATLIFHFSATLLEYLFLISEFELKKEDTTRYGSSDTVSCLVVFVARRPVRLGSSRGDRIACCYSTRKTGDEMFYYGRRFRNMIDGRG